MLGKLGAMRIGPLVAVVAMLDVASPGGCDACSGSPNPGPRPGWGNGTTGHVRLELYQGDQQTCSLDEDVFAIPSNGASIEDGVYGVSDCAIVNDGTSTNLSGSLGLEGRQFTFHATMAEGQVTGGTVSLNTPAASSETYAAPSTGSCVFLLVGSIEGGHIDLQFDCSVITTQDGADACAIREGTLHFTGCAE